MTEYTFLPQQRREASCQEPHSQDGWERPCLRPRASLLVPPAYFLPLRLSLSRFSEHSPQPTII